MDNNERYRRIRYALQLSDSDTARLLAMTSGVFGAEEVLGWRLKPDEPAFQICPDGACTSMLQGLILERRGPSDKALKDTGSRVSTTGNEAACNTPAAAPAVVRENNNSLMKQLRIALNLRAEDVQSLIKNGGGQISKSETNALFRRPDARNFRRCGDQVFKQFLAGLAQNREN